MSENLKLLIIYIAPEVDRIRTSPAYGKIINHFLTQKKSEVRASAGHYNENTWPSDNHVQILPKVFTFPEYLIKYRLLEESNL